jgi:hypothetical protein
MTIRKKPNSIRKSVKLPTRLIQNLRGTLISSDDVAKGRA